MRSEKGVSSDFCAPWTDLPPFVCTIQRHIQPNSVFSSLSLSLGNVTLFYFAITVLVVAWFSDPLGCYKPSPEDNARNCNDKERENDDDDDNKCCCCCCGCCPSWWCCRCANGICSLCCESFFGARTGPRDENDESFVENMEDTKGGIARHGLSSSMEMSSFGGRRTDQTFSLSLASESPSNASTRRRNTHDLSTAL